MRRKHVLYNSVIFLYKWCVYIHIEFLAVSADKRHLERFGSNTINGLKMKLKRLECVPLHIHKKD